MVFLFLSGHDSRLGVPEREHYRQFLKLAFGGSLRRLWFHMLFFVGTYEFQDFAGAQNYAEFPMF